nr:YibE/F family protein [Oenococcus oeni]
MTFFRLWKKFKWLFLAAIIIVLTVAAHFDYFIYKTPIAEITNVKQVSSEATKDYYGNVDHDITQKLTLKFLNTERRGQEIKISNEYFKSQVITQKYRVGQQILLSHKKWWSIIGQKRDAILVFTLALTLSLIIFFANKLSFQIILSLGLNFIFFLLAILFDINFVSVQ